MGQEGAPDGFIDVDRAPAIADGDTTTRRIGALTFGVDDAEATAIAEGTRRRGRQSGPEVPRR